MKLLPWQRNMKGMRISRLVSSGLVDPRNMARWNVNHRNSDRLLKGFRRSVCAERVVGWKIIHRLENRGDFFEVSQD